MYQLQNKHTRERICGFFVSIDEETIKFRVFNEGVRMLKRDEWFNPDTEHMNFQARLAREATEQGLKMMRGER